MNQYDVIVIGAGIAGLTCGATLAKKNYKTLVIEMNEMPGGYCTSFKRKGYTFDAAVHYNQGAVDNGWLHMDFLMSCKEFESLHGTIAWNSILKRMRKKMNAR